MAAATLTTRIWTEADILAFTPSVEASPFGPLEGLADVLEGCGLYEFEADTRRALIATRYEQLQLGRRLTVAGLVSTGDRLRAAEVLPELDNLAAVLGADQIAMATRRAHLVKAATRFGWVVSGVVLTKGYHRVKQ